MPLKRSQVKKHRSRVYVTVRCPSVRLSVRPIRPLQKSAAGLLPWSRRAGDIDRLLRVFFLKLILLQLIIGTRRDQHTFQPVCPRANILD